jgi:predicted  nucleic acid-binding Zn-ribbon protein
MFGKYSENDVRLIREENRILEMRWEVFEGLYDRTRQELEKVQYALTENAKLRQQIVELEDQANRDRSVIDDLNDRIVRQDQEIDEFRKLAEESILKNEKLQDELSQLRTPCAVKDDLPINISEDEVSQIQTQ